MLFITYILLLVVCTTLFAVSVPYPTLNGVLKASWATPWGIFTSLFVHGSLAHYGGNMIGLSLYFGMFVLTNSFISKETIRRRTRFTLPAMFILPIASNLAWIIYWPDSQVLGASGLVYALQGVAVGFSTINGLGQSEMPPQIKENKIMFLLVCVMNVFLAGATIIEIFIEPQVFLNVSAGANAFVHGICFLGALVTVIGWNFLGLVRKSLHVVTNS